MNAAGIAAAVGGARRSGRWWRCRCPVHGSRGATLALCDGDRGLILHCHAGCDRRDILAELRQRGLLARRAEYQSAPVTISHDARGDDARRIAMARRIWDAAQDPHGSPAERYLASRGLTLPPTPVLRYLAACRHRSGHVGPATIARVDNLRGEIVAIHRTWLAPGGAGKAAIDPARMTLGLIGGGAARLASVQPDSWLVAGEGVETTLSVMQACGLAGWAALSASGMRSLMLPPEARMVLIAADNDLNGVGAGAAHVAAQRWLHEGRQVKIVVPTDVGFDFNDVLLLGRSNARIAEMRDVAA
jgi:putative DNA primase/helicase